MQYIGITERGDAGIDLSWVDKLCTANILITKSINDKFIETVVPHKDNVIIHATVTGMGGSILEPNVGSPEYSYLQIHKLIRAGFPVEQIVLRIDPIIPTERGLRTFANMLELFKDTGITRVRFSVIDMYQHVLNRFTLKGITLSKFLSMREIEEIIDMFPEYQFECCAERSKYATGCISQKDIDILHSNIQLSGSAGQRRSCLCPANKKELLTIPKRCPHQCLYCYWHD